MNVLAWGDQYFLTKEDSCRHHLDSIFQAELHQAGLPFQTAIRYTMTGKTTVSKPELNLSQMHLIEEKVYYKKDQSDDEFNLWRTIPDPYTTPLDLDSLWNKQAHLNSLYFDYYQLDSDYLNPSDNDEISR